MSIKDLTSVDAFKFIAAIMVVALHTRPLFFNNDADFWLTAVCRIAVPFFFIVGSYFYFKSNKPIISYIKRLLILYFVWFVIEIPFIYERFFVGYEFNEGIVLFVKGLLIHNTFYASWYITASWQATLIVYLLSKRSELLLYVLGVFCAFLSVSNALYNNFFDNIAWNSFTFLTSICCASNSFIAAIPYCIIGRYIALNHKKLTKSKNVLIYAFLAFIIMGFIEVLIGKRYYEITDSFWSLYPISFVLVILLVSYNISINSNTSRILRKMSILIYLTHGIVMRTLRGICDIDNGLGMFLITILFSTIISYTIVKLSTQIRFLKYMY